MNNRFLEQPKRIDVYQNQRGNKNNEDEEKTCCFNGT